MSVSKQDALDVVASFQTDNPTKTVEMFRAKMPPLTDSKTRQFVLNNSPKRLMELQIKDAELENKIRFLLKPLLILYNREQAYTLIIFKHSVPFAAADTGTVMYLSSSFLLEAETDDAILGTIAHEIGHEYFVQYSILTKHLLDLTKTSGKEIALTKRFGDVLGIIELNCDAFSGITLAHLGYDPTAFIDEIERMSRKFKAEPNSLHPPNDLRRKVIESVVPNVFIKKDKRTVSATLVEIKETLKTHTVILKPLS